MNERAWYAAESLQDVSRSPSLAALAHWARRYRCYAVATLLEATADGHIYNSLVLAAPDGNFITRPASSGSGSSGSSCSSGGSSGGSSGASASGSSSTHSLALVRKHRASSLEGFVFRSAGAAGRGGESEAHVVEIDAAPLLQKRSELHKVSRGSGGSNGSGSGGGNGDGGRATGQGPGQAKLRLAFSVCYENYCTPPMEAIRVRGGRKLSNIDSCLSRLKLRHALAGLQPAVCTPATCLLALCVPPSHFLAVFSVHMPKCRKPTCRSRCTCSSRLSVRCSPPTTTPPSRQVVRGGEGLAWHGAAQMHGKPVNTPTC